MKGPPRRSGAPQAKQSAKPAFTAKDFFLGDFAKTLFPLGTNKILVEFGYSRILEYIRKVAYENQKGKKKADAVSEDGIAGAFLPQKRVFAMKQAWHTRRTVKLDVVAETFIYELAYRNRNIFRKSVDPHRRCFGYRFSEGAPIEATLSYRAFKGAKSEYRKTYNHSTSFDMT